MTKHRALSACLVGGCLLGGLSLLMAPQAAREDAVRNSGGAQPKSAGASASEGGPGIICFGHVDIDGKVLPLFPREFPNPSFVTEVAVKEGQDVKEGQVLVHFDTASLEREAAKAQAGVDLAAAAVGVQKAKLAQAQEAKALQQNGMARLTAAYQAAKFKQEAAYIRLEDARRALKINLGGSSQTPIEVGQKEYSALGEAVEEARLAIEGAQLSNPELKVDEAKAGVAQATAAVAVQQELLKQAKEAIARMGTLAAPCDGTVLRVEVAKGMTLGAQTRTPPILLQPKMKFVVRAEVDQEYAARLKVGQAASMIDEADSKIAVAGRVTHIAPAYLPKRSAGNALPFDQMNEPRVLECLIEIEGDAAGLRMGQKLRVKLGE